MSARQLKSMHDRFDRRVVNGKQGKPCCSFAILGKAGLPIQQLYYLYETAVNANKNQHLSFEMGERKFAVWGCIWGRG